MLRRNTQAGDEDPAKKGNHMQEEKRYRCTKANPWTPECGTPVVHEETRQVGQQRDGWPAGDTVTIECKNCGHTWEQDQAMYWEQELPQ